MTVCGEAAGAKDAISNFVREDYKTAGEEQTLPKAIVCEKSMKSENYQRRLRVRQLWKENAAKKRLCARKLREVKAGENDRERKDCEKAKAAKRGRARRLGTSLKAVTCQKTAKKCAGKLRNGAREDCEKVRVKAAKRRTLPKAAVCRGDCEKRMLLNSGRENRLLAVTDDAE